MTTIYIHKYALSDCIRRAEVELRSRNDGRRLADMGHCWYLNEGKDWAPTEDEALLVAERARTKKIASLKKQIAKLESMTLTVKD